MPSAVLCDRTRCTCYCHPAPLVRPDSTAGELALPRPAGQWATDYLAPALASRAVNADGDLGRGRGVVVQADELRWAELQALAEVIRPLLDFHRHMATNAVHPDCQRCTANRAYRRIVNHSRYRTVGPNTPRPKRS